MDKTEIINLEKKFKLHADWIMVILMPFSLQVSYMFHTTKHTISILFIFVRFMGEHLLLI